MLRFILWIAVSINIFFRKVNADCTESQTQNITDCLKPVLRQAQLIAIRNPEINSVRFPLYLMNLNDVQATCLGLQTVTRECLEPASLIDVCDDHVLYTIFDSLFSHVCSVKPSKLETNFQCIRNVLDKNPKCLTGLEVTKAPPPSDFDKCSAIPEFYECLKTPVEGTCGQEAIDFLTKSVERFGCDLSTTGSTELRGRPKQPAAVNCTLADVEQAHKCLAPLGSLLEEYEAKMEQSTTGVSFPVFLFERDELLEKCDSYAGIFLDCTNELFDRCKTDPLVHLVDVLLGYTCANLVDYSQSFGCQKVIQIRRGECVSKILFDPEEGSCTGRSQFEACTRVLGLTNMECRKNNGVSKVIKALEHANCH